MTTHAVLIPQSLFATNVDSLNRSAIYPGGTLDNGFIVALLSKSTTAGESEVWTATVPATGSLTQLWMVYSGDEIPTTDSKYKGLDPDPRSFFIAANKVVSVYKPQVGDIVRLTAEAVAGTKGSNTFINATDTTGGLQLYWGATKTSSVLSYQLLNDSQYINIPSGAIGDTQRITAYEFQCVGV
jgi:hypothetical protein